MKHSYQKRVVFFEQMSCKTHFLARQTYNLKKKTILTQTELKHSFQQRVVFFEQISCKTHFIARYAYNFGKGSF